MPRSILRCRSSFGMRPHLALAVLGLLSTPPRSARADPGAPDPVPVLEIGSVAPEGTPWQALVERLARHIEKESKGRIKVRAYLGGRKGEEIELVHKCIAGQIDAIGVTTASVAAAVPELQVLELPFLFESEEEADYVLDHAVDEPARRVLSERGIVHHFWAENGWHSFAFSDRTVKTPSDLKGAKVRTQSALAHTVAWKTFGAHPLELATKDVAAALQSGEVVGIQQTPLFLFASGWYRFIKHYTLSRHVYQPAMVVYSKKFFDAQSPDLQKVLLSAREELTTFGRRAVRAVGLELLKNLKRAGVNVHLLSGAERKAFNAVAHRVRDAYLSEASDVSTQLLNAVVQGKRDFRLAKR